MPSANYLLIGSTEAYSGKSTITLGLAHELQAQGITIAYGKPLGHCLTTTSISTDTDADVQFITDTLKLSENHVRPTLLMLDKSTIEKRLLGEEKTDYQKSLAQYLQIEGEGLVILEGPSNLDEGSLFELSLPQVAEILNAAVILVIRPNSRSYIDSLLSAKQRLGSSLLGVVINDVPLAAQETMTTLVRPFLEARNIPVLGILPRSNLLRSVSVEELVKQLKAQVLCRADRLDLMVESLTIGAMNVSSAIKYFRKATNMAVVTGGDRTDIQLAALETSTHCLILTGQLPPDELVLRRAEDAEVPVLSVEYETLSTVEIIDKTFGSVRLHEPVKVEFARKLMAQDFDFKPLLSHFQLGA
ncbi:MAG: phosphotransacetylase family protein [Okeania sp. SIO3I5]|uniref:phosphotransacetylase family protein n=1 Tax=Okeania sp. SIO3I5 TaxID=2607805 RepID=UPI0013BE110A|nr:phosphotransacetylase family protein [Okeania sp. SIO3I5]NEQ34991.1 phosphotransacetylase family protein [Okeania sp. SIO3I5]